MLRDDYKNLSTAEKILLVEEIWDSIAEDAGVKISPERKKLLTQREQDITEGRVKTKIWEQIKKKVTKREK